MIIPNVIKALDFAESATGVSDAYTQGFCNGLIYARALLEDKEPIYRSADEWQNSKKDFHPPRNFVGEEPVEYGCPFDEDIYHKEVNAND